MPGPARRLFLAATVLLGLLAGCQPATIEIHEPDASPFTLPIDCGPITDRLDCLVAVEVFEDEVRIPPGSRAAISGTRSNPTIEVDGGNGGRITAALYENPLGTWRAIDVQSRP